MVVRNSIYFTEFSRRPRVDAKELSRASFYGLPLGEGGLYSLKQIPLRRNKEKCKRGGRKGVPPQVTGQIGLFARKHINIKRPCRGYCFRRVGGVK